MIIRIVVIRLAGEFFAARAPCFLGRGCMGGGSTGLHEPQFDPKSKLPHL